MITESDLAEAIAECQGVRNPDSRTCIMLASFYIIREYMYGDKKPEEPAYSFAAPSDPVGRVEEIVDYDSDSDFSRAIDGRRAAEIWPVMDELMDVLQATNRRLYDGVMRKID